jgi:hypothetical protein
MTKWYYTEAYRAYAPLDAEIKELPTDEATVERVLVENVAGFFCRLSGVYRDSQEPLVVRWMHVEKQSFPVLRAARPGDAGKIVFREDMKELGFLVGAIEGEVEPKYAYCEPNKGVQTVGRAYVKLDPPTDEQKGLQRWSQGELGSCRHSGSGSAVQDCHVGCELPVLTPEVAETLKEGLDSKRTVTNLGDNLNIKYQWHYNQEGEMEVTNLETGEVYIEDEAVEKLQEQASSLKMKLVERGESVDCKDAVAYRYVRGPSGKAGDWVKEPIAAAPDVENQAYKMKWVKAQKHHEGLLARFCNESDMAYTYGILRDVKDGRYRCSTAASNVWCDECEVQVFDTTSMQTNPPDMKPREVLKPSDLPKSLFGIPVVDCRPPDSSDGNMTLKPLKDSYQKSVKAVTEIGGENAKSPLRVSRWRKAGNGDVGRTARFADEGSSWDYGVLANVAEGVPSPFLISRPASYNGQYWYERCEVEVFSLEVDYKHEVGIPVSETKAVKPLTAQAIQVAYARMKDRPKSATVSVPKEFAELADKLDDDDKGGMIVPEELASVVAIKEEVRPFVDSVMLFDHRTGELSLVTPNGQQRISAKTSWLVAKNIAKLAGAGIRDIGLPSDGSRGF